MQVTPQAIQHEMISALPDIVNDSEHKVSALFIIVDLKA